MNPGDLFIARQRFSGKNFLRVFYENRGDQPYEGSDCFEVPIGTSGIFLETVGGMHLVLFPEYGQGWVYDSWLNKGRDNRVIRKVQDGIETYGIHEVYWRSDGTIEAITENPVIPYGETPEELKKDILMQLQGLDKPILDFDLCKDQLDDGKIDP